MLLWRDLAKQWVMIGTNIYTGPMEFRARILQMDQRNDWYFYGLVQERHNSSALAMELCLPCINPSILYYHFNTIWIAKVEDTKYFISIVYFIFMLYTLPCHTGSKWAQYGRSLSVHDVIKWKRLLHCWHFVTGIHPSPVDSPHNGPVT